MKPHITKPNEFDVLTYSEIGRTTDEDGWPVVRALRSDGKKVKVPMKRWRALKTEGRVLVAPAPTEAPKGSGKSQPPEVTIAAKYREAVAPVGFFAIHTNTGARVQIVDKLDRDWDELWCYHYEYQKTMHLRRKDLLPVDKVAECVEFLKTVVHH